MQFCPRGGISHPSLASLSIGAACLRQPRVTTRIGTPCCDRGEGRQHPRVTHMDTHPPSPAQSCSEPSITARLSLVLAKGSSTSRAPEPRHRALLDLLAGIIHSQEFLG